MPGVTVKVTYQKGFIALLVFPFGIYNTHTKKKPLILNLFKTVELGQIIHYSLVL